MAITKDAEKLVSQVENGEGAKYGRDARKFAVDSWKIREVTIGIKLIPTK